MDDIVDVAVAGAPYGDLETFPVVVPRGVSLRSSDPNVVLSVTGAGDVPPSLGLGPDLRATVIFLDRSIGESTSFRNDLPLDPGSSNWGSVLGSQGIQLTKVEFNSLYGGGMRLVASGGHVFRECSFSGSTISFHVAGGGEQSIVEDCGFYSGRIGVELDTTNLIDFGGGPVGSAGGNHFACNTHTDVWCSAGTTLWAMDCFWDHSGGPNFSQGNVGNGLDVFHADGGTSIDVSGGSQDAQACP